MSLKLQAKTEWALFETLCRNVVLILCLIRW